MTRAFTQMTQRLLKEKRVNGFYLQAPASPFTQDEYGAFNRAFGGKTTMKGEGHELKWGDWLIESLFPLYLYQRNGGSLKKLMADARCHETAGFSGNWNNSFGRMGRPREAVPQGFVMFLLERLRSKYRGMPHFFFDVEHPEWVCGPLVGRPDIPKTGRTAVSCVMVYGFHCLEDTLHISIILRHLNWSHGWGDVYGGERALRAVIDELANYEPRVHLKKGNVNIFANSASMDEPKIAKQYLKEIGEL